MIINGGIALRQLKVEIFDIWYLTFFWKKFENQFNIKENILCWILFDFERILTNNNIL